MSIKISRRLNEILKFINYGDKIIDVGTDHGKIILYLADKGISRKIVGIDSSKLVINKLKTITSDLGFQESIKLIHQDGIRYSDIENNEVIVISGLGYIKIKKIIEESGSKNNYFILQPSKSKYNLIIDFRKFLYENSFSILQETIVEEKEINYLTIYCKKIKNKINEDDYKEKIIGSNVDFDDEKMYVKYLNKLKLNVKSNLKDGIFDKKYIIELIDVQLKKYD